jgi:7,8-dihydropterin-6-yl-methyl-4-(beta-D-ribofuranosyl)aminobenzene 5'-phosphate synthase
MSDRSGIPLEPLDSLAVDVLTDDVSDAYVSKTLFAVSEFSNVVLGGAKVISGETLLCANLGFGLRLVTMIGGVRRTMLFDTGPEGGIFIRNCANLGLQLGEVECIAVTHGHWDHMAAPGPRGGANRPHGWGSDCPSLDPQQRSLFAGPLSRRRGV